MEAAMAKRRQTTTKRTAGAERWGVPLAPEATTRVSEDLPPQANRHGGRKVGARPKRSPAPPERQPSGLPRRTEPRH
jgi:hypothetical protein